MSEGKMEQEETMAAMTVGPEEEKLVEAQIRARRARFALTFTKYVVWGATLAGVSLIILWFVFPQYSQLLVVNVPLILLVVSGLMYPVFHRRGQTTIGIHVCLVAFLVAVVANPLLLPDVMLAPMIGYIILIIISNLLLGAKDSFWLVPVSAFFLVIDVVLGRTVAYDWFPYHLGPTITIGADAFIGMAALLVAASIIRQVVEEQEDYLRQSKLANWQIEKHAAAEKEQRERLQAVAKEYVEYMARVGQGNLAARLTLGGNGHGEQDPLIVLGYNLNEMVVSLQRMILQIRDAALNLSSATAEILAATTQQTSGATEQSTAVSQITTTADQVKAITEQSVKRAQEVVDLSQRTIEVSRSGMGTVQETIDGMGQIKGRVEGIARNILDLSEQTRRIGEIIVTVDEIAAQSNMLALNAAVEAARAGEHGKGFSVVAAEVRNLAEQSQQATAQVRSILTSIQKGIYATVIATEDGTKAVEEGVRLAAQAQEAIERLATVIDESAQMATQMVAGGRQQASGVDQISVAMQNINQATVQNLSSTRQTEKATRELNDLARNLTESVEQYQL
jgi:methyl-accepting chemotaxis protein